MHSRTDHQFIMLGFSFMDSGYAAKIGFGCPLGIYCLMRRDVWRSERGELASFWESGQLVCRESHAAMAKLLDLSVFTVKRYISVLIKAGWIKVLPKGGRAPVYILGEIVKHAGGRQEMFYADSLTEKEADEWRVKKNKNRPKAPSGDMDMDIEEIREVVATRGSGSRNSATMVAEIQLPGSRNSATEYRRVLKKKNKEAAAAAASDSAPSPEDQKPPLDPEAVIRICREIVNLDKDDTGPIDPHDIAAYLLNSLPNEEMAEEAAKALYVWHKKLVAQGTAIASLMSMARKVGQQVLAKHKHDNDPPY